MDGILTLLIALLAFVLLILAVSRSAKIVMIIGFAVLGYIALRAVGVFG